MSHVNVVPSDVRLLNDSFVVLVRVFTGVNSSMVEPVSDGAAKGINESRFCIDLFESGADGIDVTSLEVQPGGMITKYHMVGGFLFSTQAA